MTPGPGTPVLAQQRVTMALGIMEVPVGTTRLVLGMVTAPRVILRSLGTMAAALENGEVVMGVVMV